MKFLPAEGIAGSLKELIIRKLLTLFEPVFSICEQINLCQLTHGCRWWVDVIRFRMVIKSEPLDSLGVGEVDVVLEGDAKGHRNFFAGSLRQRQAFLRRLTDQVLVIKDLSFYDLVVEISSELAPCVGLKLIVESFSNYDNVGVLSNRARGGIHVDDSVRREAEVGLGP